MAKPIKLTPKQKQSLLRDISELLDRSMSMGNLKIKRQYRLNSKTRCEVRYTAKAWYKTIMLIDNQDGEVGWHGVCHRDEDNGTVFHIDDILLYPQKVSGKSVEADTIQYTDWMNALDDKTFNHLRAFIHSHVRMRVRPSGKDRQVWDDRLSQLGNDEFYIFQIMNKHGEIYSEVYDLKNNIFYEDEDVSVTVESGGEVDWDVCKTIGNFLMSCQVKDLQLATDLFVDAEIREFLEQAEEIVTREIPRQREEYDDELDQLPLDRDGDWYKDPYLYEE